MSEDPEPAAREDQEPQAASSTPAAPARQGLGLALFLIALVAAASMLFPLGGYLSRGIHPCFGGANHLICTVPGQWVVAMLPGLGCVAAAGIAAVGGGLALTHGVPIGRRLAAAATVPLLCTLVSVMLASNYP